MTDTSQTLPPLPPTSDREKAIDAFMALLADRPIEQIGLAEVAGRAGIKLSKLREYFGSTLAIYAAHVKEIDRLVLDGRSDQVTPAARLQCLGSPSDRGVVRLRTATGEHDFIRRTVENCRYRSTRLINLIGGCFTKIV